MSTSSQTPPGALPPDIPSTGKPLADGNRAAYTSAAFAAFGVAIPAPAGSPAEASPDVPAHLVVPLREPQLPECLACGDREGPWYPDPGGRRYASGAQVQFCGTHVPDATSAEAVTAVVAAEMAKDQPVTARDIAAAEIRAGVVFDAAHVQAAVDAAREQQYAVDKAELDERGRALAVMADRTHQLRQELAEHKRKLDAVLRLVEGRPAGYHLSVGAILEASATSSTPYDTAPMTLKWTGEANVPDAHDAHKQVVVECTSSYGGRADLVIEGDDRVRLASLLDSEVIRDINAPCPHHAGCGATTDYDMTDPKWFGWVRLDVAGLEGGPRWYCSPGCVNAAMLRAADDLALGDQAELDGGL